MSPAFSRFIKSLLVGSAAALMGFGISTHAVAQKGNYVGEVSGSSSGFFSFNLPSVGSGGVVQAAMLSTMEAGKIDTLSFKDGLAMKAFYAARNNKPLWVDSWGSNHDRVAGVIAVLDQAWTQGLNPKNYHIDEIRALAKATQPAERAQLELLVSDAVIRYGHDMTGMRFSGAAINQDPQFWRKPADANAVLSFVSGKDNVTAALDGFEPRDALYQRLREELVALASHPDRAFEQYLPISFSGATLRPGDVHRDVPKLRARMGMTYNDSYGPEKLYDDALAAAVMEFQRENSMEADGVIGPQTLALLNRSTKEKIGQIVANMERLRWIDADKPSKYILVNIPSATLWAVDNNQVALEMPVIVGRPERPTKSFITNITGVRFNPNWTVPPTIKSKDFLPKLVEDPTYLQSKGIEVSALVDGKRRTLDPNEIDWANVSRADLAKLSMVQGAGDNNALGRVRVLMANPYDIYLHDTNAPELFKKPGRALSSGCIRLSDPEAVAKFILTGTENWSDERMEKILGTRRTSEVSAGAEIPVYILYQTVWLDHEGRLVYGPDIYKQDKRMLEAMASLKAYHIPESGAIEFASATAESPAR